MITSLDKLDANKTYSYADYLTWKFSERVELLRGRIFKMSPAPSRKHQEISGKLFFEIYGYLINSPCKVFDAPFDVLLSRKGTDSVVQPDICVICDHAKLTDQGCSGAPDLVIEILSPGNSNKELTDKFQLYEENGVVEYWLVEPVNESITIYTLDDCGKYIGSKPFVGDECAKSTVIAGFSIVVNEVFAS